ncbi:hypothetical protein BOTBODRAFT_456772 [Botryobasidium botryosum FD-172 SS1]|uniref:Uncharacterized protein n=1 Tax=Botryobasidium botryosum (strain FD-172 SS1) TaxID=930990 RepID=A0A067M7G4_BOTB1|nr:hypothetical protein BOTBODRAFT_456772 [Botryobasidium botryosum FD-172 SS1]
MCCILRSRDETLTAHLSEHTSASFKSVESPGKKQARKKNEIKDLDRAVMPGAICREARSNKQLAR